MVVQLRCSIGVASGRSGCAGEVVWVCAVAVAKFHRLGIDGCYVSSSPAPTSHRHFSKFCRVVELGSRALVLLREQHECRRIYLRKEAPQ